MKTYARITLEDGQKFILCIEGETNRILRGTEVDNEGDEVVKRVKGKTVDITKHIIEKGAITKRVPLVMNNTYARLEKA